MKGCPQKAAALLTHGVVLSVECDDSCTCPGLAGVQFRSGLGLGIGLGLGPGEVVWVWVWG